MPTSNQVVQQRRRAALRPEVPRELGDPGADVDERGVLERVRGVGEGRRGEERERELRDVEELCDVISSGQRARGAAGVRTAAVGSRTK